jgi:ABC-type branched-subunit amino acid transport system ATPase component
VNTSSWSTVRTMAAEPVAVLLDEPSAGLNATETVELSELLRGLAADGVALLVVDHKIDLWTAFAAGWRCCSSAS